jgi:hypothetical protein
MAFHVSAQNSQVLMEREGGTRDDTVGQCSVFASHASPIPRL